MVVNIYLQKDESMMIINSVKMSLLFFLSWLLLFILFLGLFVVLFCFVLFFQVNALQDARFSARGKI